MKRLTIKHLLDSVPPGDSSTSINLWTSFPHHSQSEQIHVLLIQGNPFNLTHFLNSHWEMCDWIPLNLFITTLLKRMIKKHKKEGGGKVIESGS